MDSASLQFILFGLAVAMMTHLGGSARWRATTLLLASLVFLAAIAPRIATLIPLLGFLALGYAAMVAATRPWRHSVTAGVIAIVLSYAWLKKYTFLPVDVFLASPYLTLGLSYIFFRVLHLVIESGGDDSRPPVSPASYLLFNLNFLTFVSGPIQRYEDFSRDVSADPPAPLTPSVVGLQVARIIRGYFKVNVLAMIIDSVRVASLADLAHPLPLSGQLIAASLVCLSYPFFLYCNFSGYIDIVIALARLMRLRLPENFDRPFSATSFIDFWNRWHITLSTWLKTYVYNPLLLGLMRRVPSAGAAQYLGVISFFATFFLIGIWHGRTSEYAVFGVLQGGGVAVNKLWQIQLGRRLGRKRYQRLASDARYAFFARGLTFTWFAFTLFWFWASWPEIGRIVGALRPALWAAAWLAIWLIAATALGAWNWAFHRFLAAREEGTPILTHRHVRTAFASALALISFIVVELLNQPAPGIIYKAF
jgi:D-alanyl-lipoteichoic acid acyltransferase DltB (MBOAT superfamily)